MGNLKKDIEGVLKGMFVGGDKNGAWGTKEATIQIINLIESVMNEVIGAENEHYKDMPVPDPDPFALPSDHQNQLRRYQLKRLNKILGKSKLIDGGVYFHKAEGELDKLLNEEKTISELTETPTKNKVGK